MARPDPSGLAAIGGARSVSPRRPRPRISAETILPSPPPAIVRQYAPDAKKERAAGLSPLTALSTPTLKCMGERPRPQLRQLVAEVPARRHGPRPGGRGRLRHLVSPDHGARRLPLWAPVSSL